MQLSGPKRDFRALGPGPYRLQGPGPRCRFLWIFGNGARNFWTNRLQGPGPRALKSVGPWARKSSGPKIWGPKNGKNKNPQNPNPCCPKCRQGFYYPEKNLPGPIWGPPGQFFAWAGKIQKLPKFCLFSLVGPWALFTRFGALAAIHPRWGNR